MTADGYPLQVLLVTLAGWVNRHQQRVIEYLVDENRVLGRHSNRVLHGHPSPTLWDEPDVPVVLRQELGRAPISQSRRRQAGLRRL